MSDRAEQVDVLEGGTGPSWWQRAWAALSPAGRRLVAAVAIAVLLVAGVVWLRDRAAERELARTVELAATLTVWSSSTSRPGGEVRFFAVVGNDGPRPVSVTALEGSAGGLRLSTPDGDRPVGPGGEIAVPLSARVTCAEEPDGSFPAGIAVEIRVRRADGGAATRRVELGSAALVLDVAATLCGVRPDLVDHELSGPVLRPGQAKGQPR